MNTVAVSLETIFPTEKWPKFRVNQADLISLFSKLSYTL